MMPQNNLDDYCLVKISRVYNFLTEIIQKFREKLSVWYS